MTDGAARCLSLPVVIVTCAAVAACSAEPFSPAVLAGEYSLESVDGVALPIVFPQSSATLINELNDGLIELAAEGTFVSSFTHLLWGGGVERDTVIVRESGLFSLAEPDSIFLQASSGRTLRGTVRNDTLSVVIEGSEYTYLRRR